MKNNQGYLVEDNKVTTSDWFNSKEKNLNLKDDIIKILKGYQEKKRYWVFSRANAPLANQYEERIQKLNSELEEEVPLFSVQLRLEIYCLYFNLIAKGSWELANSIGLKILEYFCDPAQPDRNSQEISKIRSRQIDGFNSYRQEHFSFFTSDKRLISHASTETKSIKEGTVLSPGTFRDYDGTLKQWYINPIGSPDPIYLWLGEEFNHNSLFRREGCLGHKLGVRPTPPTLTSDEVKPFAK